MVIARIPCLGRLISVVAFAFSAAGCGSGHGHGHAQSPNDHHGHAQHRRSGSQPIKVVCTVGMVADLVTNVGGAAVSVSQLMGAGVDPHLYKASPGDVRALAAADMVFYSGRHLEGKMGDVLERMASKKPTIAVADRIDADKLLKTPEGTFDPHLWFDVSLWSEAAAVVRAALAEYDPDSASAYEMNCKAYRAKLADTHEFAKRQIATIPEEQRVLVTAHDAFEYFGRAYGIKVRGVQGWSTDTEAGVKEINEMVDLLTRQRIKAVFVETSVNDRNVKALVEGCRARGHAVRIGGSLFSDAMGDPGTEKGTYIGMVTHNVLTIVEALK